MSKELGSRLAAPDMAGTWLREQILAHLTTPKTWEHDRSAYVSASTVYRCQRALKFSQTRDTAEWTGNGYTVRGDTMEEWLCKVFERIEREFRVIQQQDIWFTAIGDRQETLRDEALRISATPDGFMRLGDTGEVVYLEIKSIDPRVVLNDPKPAHVAQCQFGMELCHRLDHSKPQRALLIYIDASDYADITIFEIARDPVVARELLRRAQLTHAAQTYRDLPAEGLASGGAECKDCALYMECSAERAATVGALDPDKPAMAADLLDELDDLARDRVTAAITEAEAKRSKEALGDRIRNILEEHGTSVAQTPGFKIRYSVTKGRESFDRDAAEADGLDLSPYMRRGNGFPRLTVTENKD